MELCRGAIFSLFYIKKWGEASWQLRLTCKQTGCHWHGTILQLWLSKLQMSTRWQCLNLSHDKEVELHRPSVNTAEKERRARNREARRRCMLITISVAVGIGQDAEGRRSQIQSLQLWRQKHLQEEGDEKDYVELVSCIMRTRTDGEGDLQPVTLNSSSSGLQPKQHLSLRHMGHEASLVCSKWKLQDIFHWIQGHPPSIHSNPLVSCVQRSSLCSSYTLSASYPHSFFPLCHTFPQDTLTPRAEIEARAGTMAVNLKVTQHFAVWLSCCCFLPDHNRRTGLSQLHGSET